MWRSGLFLRKKKRDYTKAINDLSAEVYEELPDIVLIEDYEIRICWRLMKRSSGAG